MKPQNRIWIWVVLAFVLLITAWGTLIFIAESHQPESIEVPKAQDAPEP